LDFAQRLANAVLAQAWPGTRNQADVPMTPPRPLPAPSTDLQPAPCQAADRHGVCIGTSGWSYHGWRGPFYPAGLAKKQWLAWYACQFATTEVNGSFYRTPSLKAVREWRRCTPAGFSFAWKASKFITHWKRLNPDTCANSLALMLTRLKALGPKAGPVLFQLPANFEIERERLASFLGMLPKRFRYAVEFRHRSWYDESIFALLREREVALCLSDHHHAPAPWRVTAGHVYVRGHGPSGRYKDNYPEQTLRKWSRQVRRWQDQGKTVFVYFDNDQKSAAPTDARRLATLLKIKPPRLRDARAREAVNLR
jgi:uncharacterized protein YecE (DUF72 family)